MKYIHIYETRADYNAAEKEEYDMSLIVEEDNFVVFKGPKQFYEQYFTIESLTDNNTISVQNVDCDIIPDLKYSNDFGNSWSSITITTGNSTIVTTINTGDKILFKGQNTNISSAWNAYNKFSATGNFKVYGNALSLLYNDKFVSNIEFPSSSNHNLSGLFYGTTTLTDASDLILTPLTCKSNCYNGMFRECTNLSVAPKLPATSPAEGCYSSMFEGCINLLEAPNINFTTTAKECCQRMFCMDRNSKITTPKMTKSPILRATKGVTNCYKEMFKGNGNLVEVTCLMTSTFQCQDWLTNCSNTGTFYKASGASWASNTNGIPSGWTTEIYSE